MLTSAIQPGSSYGKSILMRFIFFPTVVYRSILNIAPRAPREDLAAHSRVLFRVCSLLDVWDRGWLFRFREEAYPRGPRGLSNITDVTRGVE